MSEKSISVNEQVREQVMSEWVKVWKSKWIKKSEWINMSVREQMSE